MKSNGNQLIWQRLSWRSTETWQFWTRSWTGSKQEDDCDRLVEIRQDHRTTGEAFQAVCPLRPCPLIDLSLISAQHVDYIIYYDRLIQKSVIVPTPILSLTGWFEHVIYSRHHPWVHCWSSSETSQTKSPLLRLLFFKYLALLSTCTCKTRSSFGELVDLSSQEVIPHHF